MYVDVDQNNKKKTSPTLYTGYNIYSFFVPSIIFSADMLRSAGVDSRRALTLVAACVYPTGWRRMNVAGSFLLLYLTVDVYT